MRSVSLTIQISKVRGESVEIAFLHNGRSIASISMPYFPKNADPKRVKLNTSMKDDKFPLVKNEEELLLTLKNMFNSAKKGGLLPKGARFPRHSVTYKQRNGEMVTTKTAFLREIVIQLGKQGEVGLPNEVYMKIANFIGKLLNNRIAKLDIHRDETSEHMHLLITHWSLNNKGFSNWFKKKKSNKLFQQEVSNYIKDLVYPYGLAIKPLNPKVGFVENHIPHKLYKRFLAQIDEQISLKQKELAMIDKTISEIDKIESEIRKHVADKYDEKLQMIEDLQKNGIFKDSLVEDLKIEIELSGIAAALALIEISSEQNTIEINDGDEKKNEPKFY
jgi:REP element-mobilizing transposase RayT